MCSVPERQAFRHMIYAGWCEAEITHRGRANPHTWWPYQHGAWPKKQGLRIDSFLLSPAAADIIHSTGVADSWRDEVQGLRIDSFLLSPAAADSVHGTGVSDS